MCIRDRVYPKAEEFMPLGLTEKLSTQLANLEFSGLIIFSGFVEPLLDKKIYDHVALSEVTSQRPELRW